MTFRLKIKNEVHMFAENPNHLLTALSATLLFFQKQFIKNFLVELSKL